MSTATQTAEAQTSNARFSTAALARTLRTSRNAADNPSKDDKDMLHMSAEAQWMLSILDDVSSKLSLISYLTPDIMKDSIIDALNPDIAIALRVHFQVEKQYENLLELIRINRANAGNNANNMTGTLGLTADLGDSLETEQNSLANLEEQLNELDLCVADNTRTVVRLLKENPLLIRRLRELSQNKSAQAQSLNFTHMFSRLRSLMYSTLRLSADEESTMKEQIELFKVQEIQHQQMFLDMSEKLSHDRTSYVRTLSDKDSQINELRQQIDDIKNSTALAQQNIAQSLSENVSRKQSEYDHIEKNMTKELHTLETHLESVGLDNYRNEIQKHRQKDLRINDINNTIDKYDRVMEKKHQKIVNLVQVYEKEARQLKTLEVYLEKRNDENERARQEISNITNNRDTEIVVERRRNENSIIMQQFHGGYLERQAKEEKLLAKIVQMKKDGKLKPGQSIAAALKEAQANGGVIGGKKDKKKR